MFDNNSIKMFHIRANVDTTLFGGELFHECALFIIIFSYMQYITDIL